jgi:hypothetical protein
MTLHALEEVAIKQLQHNNAILRHDEQVHDRLPKKSR